MMSVFLASLSEGAPSPTSNDDIIRSKDKDVISLTALKENENSGKSIFPIRGSDDQLVEGEEKEILNLDHFFQEINQFSSGIENKIDEINKEDDQNRKDILSPKIAIDVAEYVLKTGDENSIVEILEKLLDEGKLSEEDTLAFLENIKMYMEEAKIYLELVQNLQNSLTDDTSSLKLDQMEDGEMETIKDMMSNQFDRYQSLKNINEFLDTSFKKNKIPGDIYIHLKETIMKAALEVMKVNQKKF